MHSFIKNYQIFTLLSFLYICHFLSCADCCFDHKWTVGRPGQCCSQSSSRQWNYCLCSRWVWKLLLWILSTSPLQQPFRFYPSSARLSAVFAVRNSCPVHLNSLDSVWVFVCRSLISEYLSVLMLLYVYTPSLLAHTVPCPFPPTHRHKHTSPQLTPHSLQRCNNYCSLANGVLIAVIFH